MGGRDLVKPPRLRPGARVALIAPSAVLLERDDLARGVELCRALGFVPVLGDDTVDAVWCLQGGFGTTRILDRVDFAAIRRRPKPVIGYSDITALINAIALEAGVIAFHGPFACDPFSAFTRRHFERVLCVPEPA